MRPPLKSLLAGAVPGYNNLAPRQAVMDGCADAGGFSCIDRMAAKLGVDPKAASPNIELVPVLSDAGRATKQAVTALGKLETQAPLRVGGAADRIIDKAKVEVYIEGGAGMMAAATYNTICR